MTQTNNTHKRPLVGPSSNSGSYCPQYQSSHVSVEQFELSPKIEPDDMLIRLALTAPQCKSGLDVEGEQRTIKIFKCKMERHGIFPSDIKKVLKDKYEIFHVVGHGGHQSFASEENQFLMSFEADKTIRVLMDEHPKSAYYAAIAVLFEAEIINFVQKGSRGKWSEMILSKCRILAEPEIQAILKCICERFGCSYSQTKDSIQIKWGSLIQDPYSPIELFLLSKVYKDDPQVKSTIADVVKDYLKNRPKWQASNPYLYDWDLMGELFHRLLFSWVCSDQCEEKQLAGNELDAKESGQQSPHSPEARTTRTKLGTLMQLTYELKVSAKEGRGQSESLKELKTKVIQELKRLPEGVIVHHAESNADSSVELVQFNCEGVAKVALTKVAELNNKPGSSADYTIELNPICRGQLASQKEVGYIEQTELVPHAIDVHHQQDVISKMVKQCFDEPSSPSLKLVLVNTCNSFPFGRLFTQQGRAESVICVSPYTKVLDTTAKCFAAHFYSKLSELRQIRRRKKVPGNNFAIDVRQAFAFAKQRIAEECRQDVACEAHSHCYHLHLHSSFEYLDWGEMQERVNDNEKFSKWQAILKEGMSARGTMCRPYHHGGYHLASHYVHDGRTLVITNLSSKHDMNELVAYLEDHKSEIVKEKKAGSRNPLSVLANKPRLYCDRHFPQLFSWCYLQFQNAEHREKALQVLERKQQEESLHLSKLLLGQSNVAWLAREVPNCCCGPHLPHRVEDKFLLFQWGHPVNRQDAQHAQHVQHDKPSDQQDQSHHNFPSFNACNNKKNKF